MILVLSLVAAVWIAGTVLMVSQVRRAPEAIEDENGFRVIAPPARLANRIAVSTAS